MGENIDEILDRVCREKGVLALTLHMYEMHPLNVKRFGNKLEEIKKRGVWTPTFLEFCQDIERMKEGSK